jgi:hypothetical protein
MCKALEYTWETLSKTLERDLDDFCDNHVSDPIVKYTLSSITIDRRTNSKPDGTLLEPSCKDQLVIVTSPARTRARVIFKSEPSPAAAAKVTPKKEEAKDSCVPASGE